MKRLFQVTAGVLLALRCGRRTDDAGVFQDDVV